MAEEKRFDPDGVDGAAKYSGQTLRQRAEETFPKRDVNSPANIEALTPEEIRLTLHELRVHQVELEMQNEELRRTQGDLELSRARYFELYDLAPVGYFTISEKGLILEANLKAATLLGETRNVLVKQPLTRFILPADQGIYYGYYKLLFKTGAPQACELRMVKKAGIPFWVRIDAIVKQATDGTPVCLAAMSDISETRQAVEEVHRLNADLEQLVAKRTAQLEIANKELKGFAYTVSHDLKAPLRTMDGYIQILLEDHGDHLDGEGKRTCEVISNNARKMRRLIDALLAFSRIAQAEMRLGPVDMAILAKEVFFELTTHEMRERIDFHLAPLPQAVGDQQLLHQVWMNLLGNAVKFSAQKEQAVIEVGCLRKGNEIAGNHGANVSPERLPTAIPIADPERVYFIRDNGAGFDMTYAGKLFGVFQRLHSEKEFEGTGAGLAITRRIIQRHGGLIWAEGKPGKGATFYFSLLSGE